MHRKRKSPHAFIVATLFLLASSAYSLDAYYTKISKGEAWEKHSRTTEHPDIVVRLSNGQMVFWRGSSYLPYWETSQGSWMLNEVVPRKGDGTDTRPDAANMYSHVRIISSDEEQVVVHWRYLPTFSKGNPKGSVDHLTFVDEYFAIHADGSVTRNIRQGTPKISDWENESNVMTENFKLMPNGISGVQTIPASGSSAEKPASGNPLKGAPVIEPVMHFKFDEAAGIYTTESKSARRHAIAGHKSYWKTGVSGTALAFDSYASAISIPAAQAPSLSQFTIEAWVVIGAYPFNWAPILQQSTWKSAGYYLGVDATGKIGLKLGSGSWTELATTYELPLRQWTHIAATYDGSTLKIYVNGEEKDSRKATGGLAMADSDLIIGMNNEPQIPFDPVRPDCDECHTPTVFGIDALLDELMLYAVALAPDQIAQSFANFNPGTSIINNPDLEPRVLPTGPTTGEFAANYTKLKYYDTWDNLSRFGDHADVVVEFDELPTRFIFWRGTCYVPQVVNAEHQWYNNQFNESWDAGGSWGEPMSDKQSNITHVRIIEDTQARKVIHWRYAQVQINGKQQNYDDSIGWGDWSDWYYYIYPDGVACKRMVHWSGDNPLSHEWQESIGVMGPGQTPESISYVYDKTVTFDDFKITQSYDWGTLDEEANVPLVLEEDWERRPLKIQLVNYKSEYKPFTIADFRGGECYGDFDGRIAPYSNMVVYIHWPLGQLPTDGTRALKPDRGSSNGYTHLMFRGSHRLGDNWAERVMLEGMTNKSAQELRPLAKSWLQPAKVRKIKGAESLGYDQAQRAYVFSSKASKLAFRINGTENNPIVNPCFVIKNWKGDQPAALSINGKPIAPGADFRQGIVLDTDGTETMVLYAQFEATSTTKYEIQRSAAQTAAQ